jgi:hypothetical protein
MKSKTSKKAALSQIVSLSIVRMLKSRRLRWEGHVARMQEERNMCKLLVG